MSGANNYTRRRGTGWSAEPLLPKLRIVQANLHKSASNTSIFFHHAVRHGADLLLLEEPFIFQQPGNTAWLTSSLPGFVPLVPSSSSAPRVATLVSQRVCKAYEVLQRPELAPAQSRDMLAIDLIARRSRAASLRAINCYNPVATAPQRDARLIPHLISIGNSATPTLVVGDFNSITGVPIASCNPLSRLEQSQHNETKY